ncbi:EAL domain-containing response regulator [Castellaniella sp.]|uniref:EAL domain-containing response regulator n=1 Tax=Castellaniella sp. TaxID=1955812 RepID=UPI002AFDD43F|nr:EAL domain-containing response regulator [Castellaniella sp.]
MPDDCRVLILDDNPVDCVHMESLLNDAGFHQITSAYAVPAAFRALRGQPHQIVILDLDMPDTDGVQFIDQLSGSGLNPVLAIASSHSRPILQSVDRMARERGFAVIGHFSKPFSPEQASHLRRYCLSLNGAQAASPQALPVAPHLVPDAGALHEALCSGAIQGWFQPKLSLETGRIAAAEVLARWPQANRREISPGTFLSAVRKYGLEQTLLLRMLDDGLCAYDAWARFGYIVPIAVNLPVPLLAEPGLPDLLLDRVVAAGVPPSAVSFELLEDETIDVPGAYQMGVSRLRLKGFGLAQDDFGRGYSSLYNLISTPFTELKVDRALVSGAWQDATRAAALSSTVALGKELGLTVTAEGVETEEDKVFLRRIGCDYAQGFLISAAVDAARFARQLTRDVS